MEKKYNKLISQIRKQGVEFMVNTAKKNSIDGGVESKTDVSPRSPTKQMVKQEELKQQLLSPSNRKGLNRNSSKKAIPANRSFFSSLDRSKAKTQLAYINHGGVYSETKRMKNHEHIMA